MSNKKSMGLFAMVLVLLITTSAVPSGAAYEVGPVSAGPGTTNSCNNYGFAFHVGVYNTWQCNASTNVCENGTGSGAGAGAGSGGGSKADAGASATAGSDCGMNSSQNATYGGIQPCVSVGESVPACVGEPAGASEIFGLVTYVGGGDLFEVSTATTTTPMHPAVLLEQEGSCDNYGVFVSVGVWSEHGCEDDSCDNYGVFVFLGPLGDIRCDQGCGNEGLYVAVAKADCHGRRVGVCIDSVCASDFIGSTESFQVQSDCPVDGVPFVCRAFVCEPQAEPGHTGLVVGWECGGEPGWRPEICDAYDYPECWALRMACFYVGGPADFLVHVASGGLMSFHCDLQPGAGGS